MRKQWSQYDIVEPCYSMFFVLNSRDIYLIVRSGAWLLYIKLFWPSDAMWRHSFRPFFVQVMPDGIIPLAEPVLANH